MYSVLREIGYLSLFRTLVGLFFLLQLSTVAEANNVQVDKSVRIIEVTADTVTLEFKLTWDNSWRDAYNWDAAWVFFKFKKKDNAEKWHHAYIGSNTNNAGAGMTYTVGKTLNLGQGVFIYRATDGSGPVRTTVQVKWAIKANANRVLTPADFDNNGVNVIAHAIEMVYVPSGRFYAGDGSSNNSFTASRDMMQRYKPLLSSASVHSAPYPEDVVLVLDGNHYHSHVATNYNDYLIFDMQKPVNLKSFGIRGHLDNDTYSPKKWCILGSSRMDFAEQDTLFKGVGSDWDYACSFTDFVPDKCKVRPPYNSRKYRYFKIVTTGQYFVSYRISMFGDNPSEGYLIEDEALLNVGTSYFSAKDADVWSGNIPAVYPKGFGGFYSMKYEVSQEQYVGFLNKLTYEQQKSRVANDLEIIDVGDYVFGNRKIANNRNGIVLGGRQSKGESVTFCCDLNKDGVYFGEDDGQTVACNYMSIADMLSYCDWSGLRPMSELEYEKACRANYPQRPVVQGYAWNSIQVEKPGTIVNSGHENETPDKGNVNAGSNLGPLRCGSFALPGTNREKSGAGFWGTMDMSGNLAELCYNVTPAGRAFNAADLNYSHGNGVLAVNGHTDIGTGYWPQVPAAFALRGGSFASPDSLLRTSDRTFYKDYFKTWIARDSTVGFRAVRSAVDNPGLQDIRLECKGGKLRDTICGSSGQKYTVYGTNQPEKYGKVRHLWYVSYDSKLTWRLMEGYHDRNFTYDGYLNGANVVKLYYVKRRDVSPFGDKWSNEVCVAVVNNRVDITVAQDQIIGNGNAVLNVRMGMPGDITYSWNGKSLKADKNVFLTNYYPTRDAFDNTGDAQVVNLQWTAAMFTCRQSGYIPLYIREAKLYPSADSKFVCGNRIQDMRDNKVYGTIAIADQCWMQQNLDFRDQVIHTCYAGNNANCDVLGALYRWNEVNTVKLCPDGWHVPSDEEWMVWDSIGGVPSDQIRQSEVNRTGNGNYYKKIAPAWDGNNQLGFSTVQSGYYYSYDGKYYGASAYWWSSTPFPGREGWSRGFSTSNSFYRGSFSSSAGCYISVRCIQNK